MLPKMLSRFNRGNKWKKYTKKSKVYKPNGKREVARRMK